MRILITGGAGFIGSNFVHHLAHLHVGLASACCPDQVRYTGAAVKTRPDDEYIILDALTYAGDRNRLDGLVDDERVRFVHGDIRDAAAVDTVLADARPDTIVHFAAESHVDRSIDSGHEFVTTNVLGTQVLLDCARRRDVPRFLHVSTDEVYGSTTSEPFRIDDPLVPSSPYSASKAASDLLVMAHAHTYGIQTTVTRCTNNYGPRQHPEKLLPKVITNARSGLKIPVYGDGSNVRDWLYVKDHCAALDLILGQRFGNDVHHIAGQDERTNIELVRTVLDVVGAPHDLIEFVIDRPGHDFRYSLDDSALRASGWAPRTGFQDGLRDTIAYYGALAVQEAKA